MALLASMLMAVSAPAPGEATSSSVSYVDIATAATNAQRVLHDLAKLGRNRCLRDMALSQARRMAQQERMFHQDLGRVQRRCDMGWAGENVAYGYPSGLALVDAWMASPGHRANILNRHYRLMGIAAVKANGVWWVAQVFGTRQ